MKIQIPDFAEIALKVLYESNYEAYLVGGCVRDALLGNVPLDWDICTSAKPQEIIKCFSEYKVIETGIKHGTVTVIVGEELIEITTFRIDGSYEDYRRPDNVIFVEQLNQDLERRDFTINAMAYHPENGLLDIFGGVEDLRNKLIRCVGDPDERFNEDALRLLRALRFSASLGFSLEEKTKKSVLENRSLLERISKERIRAELDKIVTGNFASDVMEAYSAVLCVVIPELMPLVGFEQHSRYHHLDAWKHTLLSISKASPNLIIRLTLLFHDIAKPSCFNLDASGEGHFIGHGKVGAEITETILSRLKYDSHTINYVKRLVEYHDIMIEPEEKQIKRILNRIGIDYFKLLLEVKRADFEAQNPEPGKNNLIKLEKVSSVLEKIFYEQQCFSLKQLAVNGDDLISMGIPKSEKIGEILAYLLNLVIEEKAENQKNLLLQLTKKYITSN